MLYHEVLCSVLCFGVPKAEGQGNHRLRSEYSTSASFFFILAQNDRKEASERSFDLIFKLRLRKKPMAVHCMLRKVSKDLFKVLSMNTNKESTAIDYKNTGEFVSNLFS